MFTWSSKLRRLNFYKGGWNPPFRKFANTQLKCTNSFVFCEFIITSTRVSIPSIGCWEYSGSSAAGWGWWRWWWWWWSSCDEESGMLQQLTEFDPAASDIANSSRYEEVSRILYTYHPSNYSETRKKHARCGRPIPDMLKKTAFYTHC